MKNLRWLVATVVIAFMSLSGHASVRWDGVFLQTDFANTLQVGNNTTNNNSIAVAGGGNVAHYPNPQGQLPAATYFENGQTRFIQLRQSVVGHAAAAVAPTTLLSEARRLLVSGVGYAPLAGETADHGRNPGQAWGIKFAGVINPVNGLPFPDTNFFPERTHDAADYYRAALRVDPLNLTAAHGLLRSYYERMAAFTYAGHNGNERAARERLVSGDIQKEITVLETNALQFYIRATDELNLLTSRSLEAQLYEGTYPHLAAEELVPNRNRLLEAYCRALAHQAETVFHIGRLKQFNAYRNPLIDPAAGIVFASLLNELTERRTAMTERQLLLALAPSLTSVARAELGRCRSLLDQIQSLESAIENGRIAFVAAHNQGTPESPEIQFTFREYRADYVPFHALVSEQLSHEQFLATAEGFLTRAQQREQAGDILNRDFDVQQSALVNSLHSLTNRYFQELGTLCGWIRAESGQLVPDVVLALYPRIPRLQLHPYSGQGESLGEIGQQWTRIEQAQAELEIAEGDLEALYSQMDKKSEVAGEIAAGIKNLARIFLANGQKLEGLDLQTGKVQADAAIEEARRREGSSWFSGVVGVAKIVGGVVAAFVPGGGVASAGLITSGAQEVAGAYSGFKSGIRSADIQAKLARNLAKIQAQRTRIATLEKVAVQHQQRNQVLLQTEEALHALLLQTERQKLTILLAEQRVGSELLVLQNLVGRVQFLLQEFASALSLENANPLRSPDYRLVRDIKLREAEEAFLLAQRWVYLAAKSVEYRLNSASSDESTLIRNLVAGTLRARNAATLEVAMASLEDQLQTFYIGQNRETSGIEPDYLSIRNHIVQRNRLNPTNDLEIVTAELQAGGVTSAGHWLNFLREHLSTLPGGIPERLSIPFATSLDPWTFTTDPRGRNPLFQSASHNELIASVMSFGQFHRGIEIQLVGRSLSLGGSPTVFRLQYLGTSAVRQEQCAETGERRVRYWDIRRPDGQPYTAEGNLGINTWQNSGTPGFDEFSPANDRWVLEIVGSRSSGNAILLNNLDRIEDIRIRFWTRYFPSSSECN